MDSVRVCVCVCVGTLPAPGKRCTPLGLVSFFRYLIRARSSSLESTAAFAASVSLIAALREFTSLTKEGAAFTSSGLPYQGWDDFHGLGASPSGHCMERMWGGMRRHIQDLTSVGSEVSVELVVRQTFKDSKVPLILEPRSHSLNTTCVNLILEAPKLIQDN
jgi:hypothetical protein